MSSSPAPELQQRLAGALAGQYRIDRLLGQGGMGSVFLAQDETLDRPVAIKVIAPEVANSADVRERFILESRTVARLRHPNIVAVYSAGETDGLLWFAMEFVPGESLRDRLTREGRLDETTATAVLHDIGMALDHAHGQGLVHRDVKPENVLLDRDSGRAMLTDFGVARGLAGSAQLTGAGFVLGSPRYMSPEQASGETLDQRSDLYSLGLVAYETLTGGPAVEATSVAAILAKHLTERVPPVQEAANGVSPAVAGAVNKLLEKDPAQRFQRGAAFAAALLGEPFDDETPTPVARARALRGSGTTAKPTASRRPLAIGAAVLLAVAAGVAALVLRPAPANAKEWMVAPFEVQGPDRSLDWLREGSLNMLTLSLAQWQDLHVVDYEHTLDLLRDAKLDGASRVGLEQARTVARKAGAGRVVMGQVTEIGDSLIVTASLYDAGNGNATDKARAAGKKGTDPRILFGDIAGQLLDLQGAPRLSVDLVQQTTSSIEAYRLYLSGLRALNSWRLAQADSLFDQAIALDTTFALAYYRKSIALGWNGAYDSTRLEWTDKAQQYLGRLPARVQELVRGHVDQTRAFVAMARNDTAAARIGFLASRERLAKLVALDSTDAEAWFALADADYHVVFNTSYGTSPDSTAKYLNESLRGFRRTIQLDSTFHLAFSHLVDMYNKAAIPRSFLVISRADTIVPAGPAAYEARIGSPAEVEALRTAASIKAREAARGWIASDPDALPARMALSENFIAAREVDSVQRVLTDAMARPTTNDPFLPWLALDVQGRNWRADAAPAFSKRLATLTVDSLRAMRPGQGTYVVLSAISTGGALGRPSLITNATELYARLDTALLPGTTVRNAELMRLYAFATRAAMQQPLSATDRTQIDALVRRAAQLPIGQRDPSVPYLFYLATGDAAFRRDIASIMAARGDSVGYPELDALEALRVGDTATATRVARTIPSADSIRRNRVGSSGMRVVARAMLFERLGDARRAVELLEAIEPVRFPLVQSVDHTLGVYARQFAMRGRLYEKLGERDKAIASYERFASIWANADASLQPDVRTAREAVARLRDQSATVPAKGVIGGAR